MTAMLEPTTLKNALDVVQERFTTEPEPTAATPAAPSFDFSTLDFIPTHEAIEKRAAVNGFHGGDWARNEIVGQARRDATRLAAMAAHYGLRLQECHAAIIEATRTFNGVLQFGNQKAGEIVDLILKRADLLQRLTRDREQLAAAKAMLAGPESVQMDAFEVSRVQNLVSVLPGIISRLEAELEPMWDQILSLANDSGFRLADIVSQLRRESRDEHGKIVNQELAGHLSAGRISAQ